MYEINADNGPVIAYILKNFPKISETFIASEIYRLEQLGMNLRLFVIKPPVERLRHPIIDKIRSDRFNLPGTDSLTETNFLIWLWKHLPGFLPGVFSVARKRPIAFCIAAFKAAAQSIRARKTFFAFPKKKYFKEFLQAAAIASEILNDPCIEHIHAHFAHESATVAWLASHMSGRKFSFTAHAKDIYLESLNPAGLLKRKMDAAQFVVTCTEANRTHLRAISRTQVHCIYHGLGADFSNLLASRPDIGSGRNGRLHALAVGRLVRKKGFDIFIDACGILRKKGIDFEAVIVGENGDHSTEIERKIAEQNLGKFIRLTGAMSQAELFEEYDRATMFCLPCRILDSGDRDGIPNVIVEAMSCDLPVLTTNISGIPEIISHGSNGYLVPPDDANAFAHAMERIYTDKDLSKRLSNSGAETVRERFDGSTSAKRLANLFLEERKCY